MPTDAPTWDETTAVDDAPKWDETTSAQATGDDQASGDQLGNLGAPEGHIPTKDLLPPDGMLQ
jgi:hypothetical protein